MKLVFAIVETSLARHVLNALSERRYQATFISTTSGLLRHGNATLLIGVEAKEVNSVIEVMQEACQESKPREAQTRGGMSVYVLDVERHERI